jgi:hypothetical protein
MFGDYCNQTRQFIPTTSKKTLSNAKLRVTHEKTTCGLGLNRLYETLNG